MNESITPDAGAMAIGAPDWLEHAPRRDLIKYIRELQLQIAALGGKNLPSASGRMRSSRSHTTSSVSTRQKQRESATSLTSHSSTTSAHTIMSQSSEAKDGASIKSRKSNDSEDRRKAPVPLARLRSIGSMDDVTNGNLMGGAGLLRRTSCSLSLCSPAASCVSLSLTSPSGAEFACSLCSTGCEMAAGKMAVAGGEAEGGEGSEWVCCVPDGYGSTI
ncbi:uncharacterized protein MONBRDRAFT_23124 [Monosiga brevicollis MX1]|uniref:Uncharacterized protein n=1 Tax=Monosiga brevicollis TaxID=81824 RepID=A9UR91_MONBE|nr:uncharacterized protein MONBRDRAFT_23124 [Monosiga brevicollis MX1]EDQ92201.1 predicted protein [Monosiga brevicollis MX1]|eukprot:XP_001743487.1 hypothetical protein [Monosiga brevicollis MX1]